MDLSLLARGLVIGFSIAAPVGPIGVLCIRRTLADGRLAGFVTGLGAAVADAVYGAIAAFGLAAVSSALVAQQGWLRLGGGLFLCYLGARAFLARPSTHPSPLGGESRVRGLAGSFASTVLLTLANPMTILSFAAVFAGLGAVGPTGGYAGAALVVLGVFGGSALWWLTLSGIVGRARESVSPAALGRINRASGAVILGFGLWAILSARI